MMKHGQTAILNIMGGAIAFISLCCSKKILVFVMRQVGGGFSMDLVHLSNMWTTCDILSSLTPFNVEHHDE